MGTSLSQGELDIVAALRGKGVSLSHATLAVVMVTREHARPQPELVDIIRQYPSLEESIEAEGAVSELKRMGWLVEIQSYGKYLVQQAPDLRVKIAEKLGDPDAAEHLLVFRRSLGATVRGLGSMNDQSVYGSYLGLLQQAQREIILPMLATSPKLSSVPILQERARKGVRILALLGSPKVVARLRGETTARMAREAISGWKENARGISNFEVRVSHHIEDLYVATWMLIDGHLLRIDIYDPIQQRSLEGIMVEVVSPDGQDLNIVGVFGEYFRRAWSRAQPVQGLGRVWWWIKKAWQWLACLM